MTGGFNDPLVGGGGALVYPSIHSPNYVLGVTGWSINKDGTAQFSGLVLIGGTFTGSNWIMDSTGFYFYSGVPALGNPPIAYSAKPGVTADPKGNTLPSTGGGFSAVDANGFTVVDHAGLKFGQISPAPAAGAVGGSVFAPSRLDGGLEVQSGIAGSSDTFAEMLLQSAITAGGSQQVVSDPVKAWLPGSVHITAESWHTVGAGGQPAFGVGFANGAIGAAPAGFQLEPVGGGRVRLRGAVALTANQVGGATMFTLPAGYRPASTQFFDCTPTNLSGYAKSTGSVVVATSGAVTINCAGTNGNFVGLDGIVIELDN